MTWQSDPGDMCIVRVSVRNAGPPEQGERCSGSPEDLAAAMLLKICDVAGVKPERLHGRRRDPLLVAARWAWWTLLRERGLSYSQIGTLVSRDHSSVIHGVTKASSCERAQMILDAARRA